MISIASKLPLETAGESDASIFVDVKNFADAIANRTKSIVDKYSSAPDTEENPPVTEYSN